MCGDREMSLCGHGGAVREERAVREDGWQSLEIASDDLCSAGEIFHIPLVRRQSSRPVVKTDGDPLHLHQAQSQGWNTPIRYVCVVRPFP